MEASFTQKGALSRITRFSTLEVIDIEHLQNLLIILTDVHISRGTYHAATVFTKQSYKNASLN
jgi:hypothetical protein